MANKKLTVIQVVPALNVGGAEKGTLEIGRYLARHGHHSIVISAGGRMVEQLIDEGSEHIQADIGAKSLLTLRYIPWLKHLIAQIRPDILHIRSRVPAWVGYLAWKSLPEKTRPHLITTFHSHHSVNRYSEIMACGERVIAVSNMIRDYIVNSYPRVDPSKIRVIHRGIDTDQFTPSYKPDPDWIENWYREYPQTRGKFLITFPGRLTRKKGHQDFIAIVDRLRRLEPNIHGLIVGEADPKKTYYRKELEQLVSDTGLTDHITFTGHRNDLENIMTLSKVVLSLKSEPEAFGRTTAEALSLGIPVIGYALGGVEEQLIELFPEGLVAAGDIEAATAKIRNFLSTPPTVRPNTVFTLKKMCAETLAVYRELIEPETHV